ncbi:MMPL family transporter [bacterium]|nr:MMPL family transporter [bacterium]
MLDLVSRTMAAGPLRRPAAILAVALVLAAAGAIGSAKYLVWNANPDELANQNSKYLRDHKDFVKEFGDLDCIYVVVTAGQDQARTKKCVLRLHEKLLTVPNLAGVHASIGPEDQLRIATRAMPVEDLRQLRDTAAAIPSLLGGEGPGLVLEDARKMLSDLALRALQMSEEEQNRLGSAALFLLNTVSGSLEDSEASQTFAKLLRGESDRQFLTSDSGKLYFLRVLCEPKYQSLYIAHQVIDRIREVLNEVRNEFPGENIGLTGKQVLLSDQMVIGSRDMTRATILSTLLVTIAFIVAMRGFLYPLFAVASLSIGMCWTFGLTTLLVGELTLLSAVFTPILVGIGIDYGVHLLMRYQEERRLFPAETAMRRALLAVTRGNVTGSLTTCAAFMTALLTNSPGFSQLGLIAGTGVLLCMSAMTLVFPSMVMLHHRLFGSAEGATPVLALELPIPTRWFGPGFIVGVGLATAWWILLVPRVGFEDNVLTLQPPGLESVQWEKRVLEDGDSTLFAAITVDQLADVPRIVDRARGLTSVSGAHSVMDVIAPMTAERESLRSDLAEIRLPSHGKGLREWDADTLQGLRTTLVLLQPAAQARSAEAGAKLSRTSADLQKLIEGLRSSDPALVAKTRQKIEQFHARCAMAMRQIVQGNQLPLREALPESVRPMLMSPGGKFLVMVYPNHNIWDFGHLTQFVNDIRTVEPDVTGFPVIHMGTVNDLKISFFLSSLLALGTVGSIVWLDFRSIAKTMLAMTPLILAIFWTLGWMGITGRDFNLVTFIAVPILIGISVDNGVHLVHRYYEPRLAGSTIGSTSMAVFVTSLTNMFGFGSLMVSSHRGAQSLGLIMLVGCSVTLVASLTVLPGLVMWRTSPSRKLAPAGRQAA